MGMYDQLLSLTQQGLDRNNQIAMTSAQQPTMADVFMERFRQGGQDRLAKQKADEQAAMHGATVKNMEAQRLLQAGTLGAVYSTPDNAPFLQNIIRKMPGLENTDLGFQGANERKIVSAEQMQAERLRQQAEIARGKQLIDELNAKNAGLKPTSPLGKLLFDYERSTGIETPMTEDMLNAGIFKSTAVPNPLVPVAGQNGQIVAPFASPRKFVGANGQGIPQMPQPSQQSGGGQGQQVAPNGQKIFKGDYVTPKAAAEEAAIKTEEEGKDLQLGVTDQLIDRLLQNPSLKKGVFLAGKVRRDVVSDPSVKNLYDDLETLRNAETLQMIANMKTRGGLVVRNLAEFKALGNSLRNLDPGSPNLESNLKTIKSHLNSLRKVMASGSNATREIKRPGSTGQSGPGSLDELDKFLSEQGH